MDIQGLSGTYFVRALPPRMTYDDKYYVGFWDGQRLVAVMDLVSNYPDENTVLLDYSW